MTILMSLERLKKVFIFAVSLKVPVRDPLKFVEVMVILLADFGLSGFIFLVVK